uniref:TF-B3 domain-containing protein n=1 Tax=Oryza brachyantha TaxID=4533 RepID=J3LQW3_ORYBR
MQGGSLQRGAYFDCNRTNGEDKHFFKIMVGDFAESMTIPNEFLRNFGGKIPKSVKLETRNGLTFDVQVAKDLGRVFLQSGWTSYVSAHDLKTGDFLVFKYSGHSQLKTLIFDPNGCEKVCSYLVKKNAAHSQQNENKKRKQRENSNKLSRSPMKPSEDDLVPGCILPRRTHLDRLQRKILTEKVKALHSETPIYGYVMNNSSIRGIPCTVVISANYGDLYLPFEDGTVVLQHNGKCWNVRCCVTTQNSKRLLAGWKKFAGDNKLHPGDICLFQLLENEKKYVMNVHIIRKKMKN